MTLSVLLLAALAQPAPPPAPVAGDHPRDPDAGAVLAQPAPPSGPGALAPQPAVAVINSEGKLRITQVSSSNYGPASRDVTWTEKRGSDTIQVTGKARSTSVVLTTTELPASIFEAYTSDGKPIAKEKLAEMLAKERTVLVATDGRKVDPFYLDLYKDGTIILVPPANVLGTGAGPYDAPYGPPSNYGPPTVRPIEERPRDKDRQLDK
jgi:hypothetical protein